MRENALMLLQSSLMNLQLRSTLRHATKDRNVPISASPTTLLCLVWRLWTGMLTKLFLKP